MCGCEPAAGRARPIFRIAGIRTEGDSLKALEAGADIKHFPYGRGVVTEWNEERTSIDFDLHGRKKFVTGRMAVEPAEGTPPKRPWPKRGKKAAIAVPAGEPVAGSK